MPATAAKCNGLKLILTPIIRATMKIVAASKPPVNDFPSTIAVLGIGEHNNLSSCPRSLSQINDIPVNIEMNRTD